MDNNDKQSDACSKTVSNSRINSLIASKDPLLVKRLLNPSKIKQRILEDNKPKINSRLARESFCYSKHKFNSNLNKTTDMLKNLNRDNNTRKHDNSNLCKIESPINNKISRERKTQNYSSRKTRMNPNTDFTTNERDRKKFLNSFCDKSKLKGSNSKLSNSRITRSVSARSKGGSNKSRRDINTTTKQVYDTKSKNENLVKNAKHQKKLIKQHNSNSCNKKNQNSSRTSNEYIFNQNNTFFKQKQIQENTPVECREKNSTKLMDEAIEGVLDTQSFERGEELVCDYNFITDRNLQIFNNQNATPKNVYEGSTFRQRNQNYDSFDINQEFTFEQKQEFDMLKLPISFQVAGKNLIDKKCLPKDKNLHLNKHDNIEKVSLHENNNKSQHSLSHKNNSKGSQASKGSLEVKLNNNSDIKYDSNIMICKGSLLEKISKITSTKKDELQECIDQICNDTDNNSHSRINSKLKDSSDIKRNSPKNNISIGNNVQSFEICQDYIKPSKKPENYLMVEKIFDKTDINISDVNDISWKNIQGKNHKEDNSFFKSKNGENQVRTFSNLKNTKCVNPKKGPVSNQGDKNNSDYESQHKKVSPKNSSYVTQKKVLSEHKKNTTKSGNQLTCKSNKKSKRCNSYNYNKVGIKTCNSSFYDNIKEGTRLDAGKYLRNHSLDDIENANHQNKNEIEQKYMQPYQT